MTGNSKMIKFRPEWFEAYGLNMCKNFLQAPTCECGCDGKCNILLNGENEVTDFMTNVLLENDCGHCAIFAYSFDDTMYATIKVDNYIKYPITFCLDEPDMDFFKECDKKLNLHCYGLIIETTKGVWKIIEN